LWQELEEAAWRGPGELAPEERIKACSPDDAPEFARSLVEKLHRDAVEIEDADVRALVEACFSFSRPWSLPAHSTESSGYAKRERFRASADWKS